MGFTGDTRYIRYMRYITLSTRPALALPDTEDCATAPHAWCRSAPRGGVCCLLARVGTDWPRRMLMPNRRPRGTPGLGSSPVSMLVEDWLHTVYAAKRQPPLW